jgi:hypothetical protein
MKGAARNLGDLIADSGLLLVEGALAGDGNAMIERSGIIDLRVSSSGLLQCRNRAFLRGE